MSQSGYGNSRGKPAVLDLVVRQSFGQRAFFKGTACGFERFFRGGAPVA